MGGKKHDPPEQGGTERMSGEGGGPPSPPTPRGVILLVYYRDGTASTELAPGEPVIVGRSEPATLIVPDRTLSREHARFTLLDGHVLVEDLASSNGIFFEGQRVPRVALKLGGEVMLATALARVFTLGRSAIPFLDEEDSFHAQLEEELSRAALFGRPVAVLAARAAGPPSVPANVWTSRVREELRPVDRMGFRPPDVALIVLPEVGHDAALQVARRIADRSTEQGSSVFVGVAVYPRAATSADALLDAAREALAEATTARNVAAASTAESSESEVAIGGMVVGTRMREVLAVAERVATSKIAVLLHGETGTGKELLANYIHEKAGRKGKHPIRINCGAIPSSLVESTLFGHERGAFTGAAQQRRGVFEEADGGTLFLDEIGELPQEAQAALLRVLETGRLQRIGSAQEIEVDVRIIAATHRDLEAMIAEGRFREDLYYRLSTMVLEIPPLRERVDEIEPLSRLFLDKANARDGRHIQEIGEDARALLSAHDWPGNVRELRNAIERAVAVSQANVIQPDDLPPRVRNAGRGEERGGLTGARTVLKQKEAQMIEDALQKADWSTAKAANALGYTHRTFMRRMKEHGITKPKK
jgi:two-component system, NtrC family, response regulator AtoC